MNPRDLNPDLETTPFGHAESAYRRERRLARFALIGVSGLGVLSFAAAFFILGRTSVRAAAPTGPISAIPTPVTERPLDPDLESAVAELEAENVSLKLEIRRQQEANDALYSQAAGWVQNRSREKEPAMLPADLRTALDLTANATPASSAPADDTVRQ